MRPLQTCVALLLVACLSSCGGAGGGSSPLRYDDSGQWQIATIDTPQPYQDYFATLVGPRGDGAWRVFNLNSNWGLVEYAYDAGAWHRTFVFDLASFPGLNSYGDDGRLFAATARGAGGTGVYAWINDSDPLESRYATGSWSSKQFLSLNDRGRGDLSTALGDPRGEGHPSFYALGLALTEIAFRDGAWTQTVIDPDPFPSAGPPGHSGNRVAVGDPRRDGVDRIYVLNPNKEIVEYSFVGRSRWEKTRIPTPSASELLGVIRAHAGESALFALDAPQEGRSYYELQELLFEGGKWTLNPGGPFGTFYFTTVPAQCAAGDGRGDGVVRIYCAGIAGELSEASYTGSAWRTERFTIEGKTARFENLATALSTVAVGPGRGDGRGRVYIQRFDADLVELTFQR